MGLGPETGFARKRWGFSPVWRPIGRVPASCLPEAISEQSQEEALSAAESGPKTKGKQNSHPKMGLRGRRDTEQEASTAVWKKELQNHTLQHTVYCQDWSPNRGFSETYDGEQLFSFDFAQNTRVPRLPEFADWAQKSEDTSSILLEQSLCMFLIKKVGPQLEGKIPVSRGIPIINVFTMTPLEFGKPNTLICHVSNLFPPALTLKWMHDFAPVEGAGPTIVSAVDGLSFQAFSYLNITPASSDIYSCVVTHEIDDYTGIFYWVPHDALPSDLLENVLCGMAFTLGVVGIILGLVLIAYTRKPCSG